jgi:hypothetical protein
MDKSKEKTMGHSVLVFISHSSDDKENFIEPLVKDLEECYINTWLDKKKILPGDNLRKSIFRDGLDKADVALLFFTKNSLSSSWVDREIKHVLREETKKGNDFDLNKIISIFDTEETYKEIAKRYPELTDDLLHLMPVDYNKIHFGKLISAIWSKYLSLQGGDVETQKQLLSKDKEIFQKEKEILSLKTLLEDIKSKDSNTKKNDEFKKLLESSKINVFINYGKTLLAKEYVDRVAVPDLSVVISFGLVEKAQYDDTLKISEKGKSFFQWYYFEYENNDRNQLK